MEVPEHISVSGEPIERRERTDNSTPFLRQEESAVKLMNVPDHIALTGGDGYRAIISQPSDLIGSHMSHDKQVWLDDLPSKITLIENPYLDRDEYPSVNDHERSKQSIAIDENPLREMKKMRRQLGGVAGRLYQLEDEIEKQNSREKLVFSAIFGAAAAVLLFLLRR